MVIGNIYTGDPLPVNRNTWPDIVGEVLPKVKLNTQVHPSVISTQTTIVTGNVRLPSLSSMNWWQGPKSARLPTRVRMVPIGRTLRHTGGRLLFGVCSVFVWKSQRRLQEPHRTLYQNIHQPHRLYTPLRFLQNMILLDKSWKPSNYSHLQWRNMYQRHRLYTPSRGGHLQWQCFLHF